MSEVEINILRDSLPSLMPSSLLWHGDVEAFLEQLDENARFDLVISSPPYNIGKRYEDRTELADYELWQARILEKIIARLNPGASLCWQVGNYIDENEILPLDILFHPLIRRLGLKLRNRIVWTFGHGLHTRRRFSGRYEVVLWYTKGDDYVFELDAVRVPAKYPGKRSYRGPKRGQLSGNPRGKNPEDVWDFPHDDVWTNIPNVKSNHVEKTGHPCQFPVGLVERLVLALTKPGAIVFDPFAGVASAGVAALIHGRRFWGCEVDETYIDQGAARLNATLLGKPIYRPHDRAVYDHTTSPLAQFPADWQRKK